MISYHRHIFLPPNSLITLKIINLDNLCVNNEQLFIFTSFVKHILKDFVIIDIELFQNSFSDMNSKVFLNLLIIIYYDGSKTRLDRKNNKGDIVKDQTIFLSKFQLNLLKMNVFSFQSIKLYLN